LLVVVVGPVPVSVSAGPMAPHEQLQRHHHGHDHDHAVVASGEISAAVVVWLLVAAWMAVPSLLPLVVPFLPHAPPLNWPSSIFAVVVAAVQIAHVDVV